MTRCNNRCGYEKTVAERWLPLDVRNENMFFCKLHCEFHYCPRSRITNSCRIKITDSPCCEISGYVKDHSPIFECDVNVRSTDVGEFALQASSSMKHRDGILLLQRNTNDNFEIFCLSLLSQIPHNLSWHESRFLYDSLHYALSSKYFAKVKPKCYARSENIVDILRQALLETNRLTEKVKHVSLRHHRWKDCMKKAMIVALNMQSLRAVGSKKRVKEVLLRSFRKAAIFKRRK